MATTAPKIKSNGAIDAEKSPIYLAWKTWKNHLGGPNFHRLVPLTFKLSRGKLGQSNPKTPPELHNRTSQKPLHKTRGRLDYLGLNHRQSPAPCLSGSSSTDNLGP